MTREALLEAGFNEFPANDSHNGWDSCFQQRINDDKGTRYFIQCYFWRHSKYRIDFPDSWEIEVRYNDGCSWMNKTETFAVRVAAWSIVDDWSPADVLKWADELWKRLKPEYYEVN